ncbi:MAG: hypothetical protein LBL25_03005 [Oscillospiraceae bacterium]|jgi:ATP-dependent RNA helicase SUPV3L1/SUV3|nr:hypothetical protein [Oscillospiraceae bacterium]
MYFENWEAFRAYNIERDSPLFTLGQLKNAGLRPVDEAIFETHIINNKVRRYYTSEQSVFIGSRKRDSREHSLIKEIDEILHGVGSSAEYENPFNELVSLCRKVRRVISAVSSLKIDYPATDTALRTQLYRKLSKLRWLAEQRVREAAAFLSTEHKVVVPIEDGRLLSEATVHRVVDELVRSLIPDHPKDEFPQARLMRRNVIIHCGDTNTGKTYSALQTLKEAETGVYLAPLRLLALEVSQTLNSSGIPCNLLTGEERQIVAGAQHTASTVEMLDLDTLYDAALIDEAQMVTDPQRGSSWTRAILGVRAKNLLLCCSDNAVPLLVKLIEACGDDYTVIDHTRDTPLVFESEPFVFPDNVQPGDALIVFSRRKVLVLAGALANCGIQASVLYGALPPENRRLQTQRFVDGESSVVVATDAIGMGLNLPIQRIIFMEAEKFNGFTMRSLKASEVKQVAGRAGRKNRYAIGYVNAVKRIRHIIERRLDSELPELQRARYHPVEQYVLDLPLGTLRQRLRACMRTRDIEYMHNSDLTAPLALLEYVETFKSLSMKEQYRLIFIPVDAQNSALRSTWNTYVRLYAEKKTLPQPLIKDGSLDELELTYKRLDLYYSFCRTMTLDIDADWIAEKKRDVSEKIDLALLRDARKLSSGAESIIPVRSDVFDDFDRRLIDKLYRQQYPERSNNPWTDFDNADADARVTKATVKSRGWTDKMIRDFLPEPVLETNPHYRKAPPMYLWLVSDVKNAEATPEFIARKEKVEAARLLARRASERKQAARRTRLGGFL